MVCPAFPRPQTTLENTTKWHRCGHIWRDSTSRWCVASDFGPADVTKSVSVWSSRSLSRNTCKCLKNNVSTLANPLCMWNFVSYSATLLNTVTAIQYCSGNAIPRTCIMLHDRIGILMKGLLIRLLQHWVSSSQSFKGLYGLPSQDEVWQAWLWRQRHYDPSNHCELLIQWHNTFWKTCILSNTVVSNSNLTVYWVWMLADELASSATYRRTEYYFQTLKY